ncbi:MAG: hypothetical protein QOI71_2817 [Gaiellales bacterium]|jgi:hypothetical protein|nr:hypothetical protein [Gaiellales bacterium]
MPDNDLVPRHVRRVWRRACQAMLGGQEPLEVGREIDRTLTAVVKEQALPSPEGLVRDVRESILYSDTARYEDACARYRREAGLTDLASHVLAELAERMELSRGALLGSPEPETAAAILAGALRRQAEAGMCGPEDVTDRLLVDGASYADVERRKQECLNAAQYEAVAGRVVAGQADRMRAPRSHLPKFSQAEILAQEVP